MAKVRISGVSFKAGPVGSFDDFADHVKGLMDEAAAGEPDFIVFPELFTNELMHFFAEPDLESKFKRAARYTADYLSLFKELARERSVHIVGGSHFKEVGGRYYNTSHLFFPDGRIEEQPKVHLFPPERAWTTPGHGFAVFETDKAKVAILICYDLEFPEPARLVTLRGAEIILSPSATLDEQGYWRVRHCAQARCVEDQIYVAHVSLLGGWGAPGLEFWGLASILSPCESPFPQRGVVVESRANEEGIVWGEVDTEMLHHIRKNGAAPTLSDRRQDLLAEWYRLENQGRQ